MKYVLLVINFGLVAFLVFMRALISKGHFSNDDIFLGQTFRGFRSDFVANFKYIISFFILSAALSLFLQISRRWKIIIIASSFLGFLAYYFSYSAITPG